MAIFMVPRRHLLRSRLGDFRPGPRRRRKIGGARLVLLGSAFVGPAAWAVVAIYPDGGSSTVLHLVLLMWLVNATVVFVAMAYFLDVPRFAFYGPLFGSALFLVEIPRTVWGIEVSLWAAFGIPGGMIVAIGSWKLARFLGTHPVVPPRGLAPDGRT